MADGAGSGADSPLPGGARAQQACPRNTRRTRRRTGTGRRRRRRRRSEAGRRPGAIARPDADQQQRDPEPRPGQEPDQVLLRRPDLDRCRVADLAVRAGGAAGRDPAAHRPDTQQDATEGNLAKVGYPEAKTVFTRDRTAPIPAYLTCQATCTTVQYKSLTRKHIESLGYRIVANVGDQLSDLQGDHEQRAVKLPNPMYFIP